MEFIAPIPEQNGTSTMHLSNVSGGPYSKLPAQKLGKVKVIFEFLSVSVGMHAVLKNVNLDPFAKLLAGNF